MKDLTLWGQLLTVFAILFAAWRMDDRFAKRADLDKLTRKVDAIQKWFNIPEVK